jgi:hypothetical protein
MRNRITASLVPFLPRTTLRRIVRNLQSPIQITPAEIAALALA